jgi:hypothetical protein
VREHPGGDVPAATADPFCAIDFVAHPEFGERPGAAVGQQDRGVAGEAVAAAVTAAAVRVDRPAERHPRLAGNLVQHGLRVHLVEDHAGELWGTYAAYEARQPRQSLLTLAVYSLAVPSHDR